MSIHGLTMNWYMLNFMMPMVMMFFFSVWTRRDNSKPMVVLMVQAILGTSFQKNIQPINETI